MSGPEGKPFAIPEQLVWQAWKSVRANGGAAGADWAWMSDIAYGFG